MSTQGDRSVPRTVGVEEEFHLVDLESWRLTPRAPELLAALPDDGPYVAELQRCVIESNTGVCESLDGLRADLRSHRATLVDTAAGLGMGVVAAGTVPLAVPTELLVTETPRYRRMLADYQLLAREQLICGTQFHVATRDRDEAVAVAARVSAHIPTLLALSASSPFWADGTDTGYASARTLVWQRWPTTGPFPAVASAAEYDAIVGQLISSGVIGDPGMLYFDIRPSAHVDTLELRACDSCPSVDTIALIAGLVRALVIRAGERLDEAPATPPPPLYRAAMWQAAREGLEGDLIDVAGSRPRPAAEVVDDLIEMLRPELESIGDWQTIAALGADAVNAGSSAARQRRVLRRRGRLTAVVKRLVSETAGRSAQAAVPGDPSGTLLHGYVGDDDPGPDEPQSSYDEAIIAANGRAAYRGLLDAAAGLGAQELRKRQYEIEREQSTDGVSFRVSGQSKSQLFPLDVMPRYIGSDDWIRITDGLTQRALALNAFVGDIYGPQNIVADGIIPLEALDRAPGYRQSGRIGTWQQVRTHISGTDLVSPAPSEFLVLEDNLRVPSGIAYAMSNRAMMSRFLPEYPMPPEVLAVDGVAAMLAETIAAAAPPDPHPDGADIMITSGGHDSAWFEHQRLAEGADLLLASPADLSVPDHESADRGRLFVRHGRERVPVNTTYVRMDEDMFLSSNGHDGRPLRAGVLHALGAGRLALVNALGNGVADDKAIYAYVPEMIRYYLGREPLLAQVPTWACAERHQRDHVLENLHKLVVKPIDGSGGAGITIGPECTEAQLEERRRELMVHPERYIAQEVVALSTHPTFDGNGFYPHHVDLRVFVHLRAADSAVTAHVVPAALTRVATAGSLIVNSSRGGGGKDTWIQGQS